MVNAIAGISPQAAAAGNPHLEEALGAFMREFEAIHAQLGIEGGIQETGQPPKAASAPPLPQFTVMGVDGTFKVIILNPNVANPPTLHIWRDWQEAERNQAGRSIIHELESAHDTNFDADGGVTNYGRSTATSYEFHEPDEVRFWRLRSSYDGQTWTAWQVFNDPSVCGAVPVVSGKMRSSSVVPNAARNTTNNATVNSIADGGSATVRVYGPGGPGSEYERKTGTGPSPRPAATFAGRAFETLYFVYYNGVSHELSQTYVETLPDGYEFVAQVTTVDSGGGGGEPGGGGDDGGPGGGIPGYPILE